MPPSILILGGGTAGWMAACLMARAWPATTITVVESAVLGTIGVGEGSTPQLARFFQALGLTDADWMPAAHATYKTGIAFEGWSRAAGHERYFHPFASDVDLHSEPAFHAAHRARRQGADVPAHPDAFFLNSRLAAERRAPVAPDQFPFAAHHGYHFDAHRLGAFLRDHATSKLGVRHLDRRVTAVEVDADGQVACLRTDADERLSAAMYVDASGFAGVIAERALATPFVSYADALFVDRAIVLQTPPGAGGPEPYTTATALDAGWAWRIPLTSRVGNGYVYSSRHIDDAAAEAELRGHLSGADGAVRHIRFRVGRLAQTWRGNCLAIGLAQGFLEPLEATALHLVQASVEGFIQAFMDGQGTRRHRDAFNAAIAARYDGIRDYLVAHYRLNRRGDPGFWAENARHDRLSDSLKRLMTCWFTGGDLAGEIADQDIARYYAPLSWGCLFAGYGIFPKTLRPATAPTTPDDFLRRCATNFPDHRVTLCAMAEPESMR